MSREIEVTLTYTEEEAQEVARTFLYFTSNVSATREDHDRMALIRSAIKAKLTPPIEEPTGWGAVVEDDTGAYWTLYAPEAGAWMNYREGAEKWRGINAVRVVSEGVPTEAVR